MNLKTKSRYSTLPNTTSVELLDKPLWIAGNIFMEHYQNLSLTDIEGEVWKDYPYIEGVKVSSFGRIKSTRRGKPKILKQQIDRGYAKISLFGERKKHRVHRLVSILFIPNPQNKPEVNHKDCIRHNNHVSNLEWVTADENYIHAVLSKKTTLKVSIPKKIVIKGEGKHVWVYMSNGELYKKFISFIEAGKELGINPQRIRSRAIIKKPLFGMFFSTTPLVSPPLIKNTIDLDVLDNAGDRLGTRHTRPIKATNKSTGDITLFDSIIEANKHFKLNVRNAIYNYKYHGDYKGYLFEFAKEEDFKNKQLALF